MQTITVNGIRKVLDEALEDYKKGKAKARNIIFVGQAAIGKRSVIQGWIDSHESEINLTYDCGPSVMLLPEGSPEYECYLKDRKRIYSYDSAYLEKLNETNGVWFCKRLNFGQTPETLKPYESIFSKRECTVPVINRKYDLSNLFLIIATALPEDKDGPALSDISALKSCSDLYGVEPDVNELREYFQKVHDTHPNIINETVYEYFRQRLASENFHFSFDKSAIIGPLKIDWIFGEICGCKTVDEAMKRIREFIAHSSEKEKQLISEIFLSEGSNQ